MDIASAAINESQWVLCLLQITGLMLISWIVGRIALHRFPDVSASIGVVGLSVSAGLIVVTWAGVPRPFELSAQTDKAAHLAANSVPASAPPSEGQLNTVESPLVTTAWFDSLTALLNQTPESNSQNATAESAWRWTSPIRIVTLLLFLTLMGGLVGVFRVILSSKTIHRLASQSSLVEDSQIQAEVKRILAQLPIACHHQDIPVRQFGGSGSPFVSWLTGRTIFVPDSFLNWSDAEKSASLAHEIGHLQRHDHYCRLITQLTFCLVWLHPLAWMLHRQTVLAQELAADQVAAQTTPNPSAYCRVLSRLALRFDAECRHRSALRVSVSSSLIRRITMLKGITFHRLPCSRLVNRCVALSAFIAFTWIGCWSVSGQALAQEKQVDSKVVPASHTVPVEVFSQPATAPWEVVGNRPDYYNVQLDRIISHPALEIYRPIVTSALDSTLRSQPNETPSLKQFGLGLDDITEVQGGMYLKFGYNSLGFGAPKLQLTARLPVDWPRLINAFDYEKIDRFIFRTLDPLAKPADSTLYRRSEEVCAAWAKTAEESRSNIFDLQMWEKERITPGLIAGSKPWVNRAPTETKQAMWNAVSGGVVSIVYDINQFEAPEDLEEPDPIGHSGFQMAMATETAAWGMDLSQDNNTYYVRFAATPREGVSMDELLEQFKSLKRAFQVEAEANPDQLDELSRLFIDQLEKAKVTIVESKQNDGKPTKPFLFIEGEITVDISKWLAKP